MLLQAESCEHHASTHAVASGGALKTPSSLAVDMALSAVCRGRHLSAARPSAVGLPTVALPGPACHHAAAGRQPFHVVRAAPDAGFTTSSSGAASTSSPMVSPFTQPGVHRQVGEAGTHVRRSAGCTNTWHAADNSPHENTNNPTTACLHPTVPVCCVCYSQAAVCVADGATCTCRQTQAWVSASALHCLLHVFCMLRAHTPPTALSVAWDDTGEAPDGSCPALLPLPPPPPPSRVR